jgi:carbon monoxide dehydrogenase subunit G
LQFTNSFIVSLPPDKAWEVLTDIERIAPCMPGAELTEVVDENTYLGNVAVKMGPVVLAFAGTAIFEERDEAARRARVKAQGKDSKGRGGASAVAEFYLEPVDEGTKVVINTDLNLSGSVAQYARGSGIIQAISAQLIGQFSKALEAQISGADPLASVAAAKPIGGLSLVSGALWGGIKGKLGSKG